MTSDLWETRLITVFDHTDEVSGSGCNKLWSERPHDWIQEQGAAQKQENNLSYGFLNIPNKQTKENSENL